MLKTLAMNYKSVVSLTKYLLQQLCAVIVHGEPSFQRYTINIVGLHPFWIKIGYARAVINIYGWKADASAILG